MSKRINYFLIASLICFTLKAQKATNTLLIKEASTDPMDIPYEVWELSNGLKVLIHEDHSDPIVNIHVTYHVGSNREIAGKSGFAHFFEHMLFQGSEHVADERHFKIINDAGGDMNGNTTEDRTVYFQTVPSNYLETALWLEADRMGFLLNAVSQEKFENQRDAVTNEKYQNQISRPYGMSFEILGQNLYPPTHPYNWPVIGYVDDLDRATLQDLKDFYLKWYGPNNAYLTISGDVTSKEVLPIVEKYFGSINRGNFVKRQSAEVPNLSSDKYCSYTDPNVWMPMTDIVFPTVPNYHKDEAALDILATLLGEGNNSIFYKNFVKSEDALQANVFHNSKEIAGEMHFMIISYNSGMEFYENPVVFFNNVEKQVKTTLEEWEKKGISDEELEVIKNEMLSEMLDYKTSLGIKASIISSWEWLGRGKYNLSSEVQRYSDVTKEDIMRVYNKYIKGKYSVILTVKPKSPFSEANDSLISINPNANLIQKENNTTVLDFTPPIDNFDRNIQPKPTSPKAPQMPVVYRETLKNGIKVIGTQSSEIPKVYIQISLDGGNLLVNKKLVGLAEITAEMMNESTKEKSAEQMSLALRKLGSNIQFSAGQEATYIIIESLTKNLTATLDLLEEKILYPAFNEDDFLRIKKQYAESLEAAEKDANTLAQQEYAKQLFGETPYGQDATKQSVGNIKLKDVVQYYTNNYSPTIASIVVVGDIAKENIMQELSFLENWNGKQVSIPNQFDFPADQPTQIYLIDKAGASQSVILMGHKSDVFDVAGDHFKTKIVNFPFGGGASGRLFLNLREDKGYTYGVYSRINATKNMGNFNIFSSVKTNATDSALVEILTELEHYTTQGLTDDELLSTKNSMLNSEALKYETPDKKLGFLNKMLMYNLNEDFIQQQVEVLKNISKSELNAIAKDKLRQDKMVIVVVGNTYLIRKKLENLRKKDGTPYNYKINNIKR